MYAVAPGGGADHQHWVTHAFGARGDQRAGLDQPHAHRVHQRVAAIAVVEVNLAADRWDAEAIAVPADAAYHTREKVAIARLAQRAEAQRVQQGDRAGTLREDITDDAADTGRRALIRLDRAGVVVAFDLHDDCQAVADIYRTGVLRAGGDHHARPGGGETLEQGAAIFVAAVLAPHRAEEAQLEVIRYAPEQLDDARVLRAVQRHLIQETLANFDVGGHGKAPWRWVDGNALRLRAAAPLIIAGVDVRPWPPTTRMCSSS